MGGSAAAAEQARDQRTPAMRGRAREGGDSRIFDLEMHGICVVVDALPSDGNGRRCRHAARQPKSYVEA